MCLSQYFYSEFYVKIKELKKNYENRQGADEIPKTLGLKIILHFGEVGAMPIDKRIKLMGEDVIAAHRLLKNDIANDEYLLFSEKLLKMYKRKDLEKYLTWDELQEGYLETDHLGRINYNYIKLGRLQNDLDKPETTN